MSIAPDHRPPTAPPPTSTRAAEVKPEGLAAPEDTIRRRTGRGWQEWFDLLDAWGAAVRPHREIARHVAQLLGVDRLAWNAQAVAVSYGRVRGGRAAGQRAGGFAVTASRTVGVAGEQLHEPFAGDTRRGCWSPEDGLRRRPGAPLRSVRFDAPGPTCATATFEARGEAKSTVVLEHGRIEECDQAEATRTLWRERLTELKAQLEAGTRDA